MKTLLLAILFIPFFVHSQSQTNFSNYLVRYKSSAVISKNISATALKSYLMSETRSLQSQVFASLPKRKLQPLWLVKGSIAVLTQEQAESLKQNPAVESVVPLNRKAHINQSSENYVYGLEKIHLPDVNRLYPELTGAGVKVGIIDTGVDPRHPDLKDHVVVFKDFIRSGSTTAYDDHGHGTHVAGTISGSRNSRNIIGIAPEAKLVVAKVFSKYGGSSDTDLLKSLQWMADPDGNPATADQPQVINNSWNIDDADYSNIDPQNEPFCVAIQNLNSMGISVVFAAGNDGPSARSIKTPASCPEAISVGATDSSDNIADFSSRGPVKWKSVTLLKPDLSAPGDGILSASPGGGYQSRSGTSMAAPHVVGALALLYQIRNDLKPQDYKQILMNSSDDLGASGPDTIFGSGRLNILASVSHIRNSQIKPGKIIGQNDLILVKSDASNIPEEFRPLVDAIGWTNYGCTVTHIGKGYALSAGHCFEATADLVQHKSCSFVSVEWGYRENQKPVLKSDCQEIVALMETGPIDFALLKMKTYPKAFISPNLTTAAYPSSPITIFSHPDGQPLSWSQYCSIERIPHPPIPADYMQYSCDTMGGSSGAAILDPTSLSIVGLHAGGEVNMNYGTHLLKGPLVDILKSLGFE